MQGETTMFTRVILQVKEGQLKGKELILENETDNILGRSEDCSLPLEDPLYRVSRHHCRITVSSPHVRVQDLGSLNGTYVNGQKIGQRQKGQTFEQAMQEDHVDYPLWQGDKLRIGEIVFDVEFDPPIPGVEDIAFKTNELWSSACEPCGSSH
jgi:eukaryotic-like serine/threonine-protein kinase